MFENFILILYLIFIYNLVFIWNFSAYFFFLKIYLVFILRNLLQQDPHIIICNHGNVMVYAPLVIYEKVLRLNHDLSLLVQNT
jgi:1-acyl-sn-glycerol-3-phosphate acyltransferase